jgi:acetolactate synthase-1/2/3 large subunit
MSPADLVQQTERRDLDAAQPATAARGADLLVDALIRAGVKHLFGVPGDTGVVLYDALGYRTEEIRHVLARDERHAAAMADAYARVTREVGVVEVSSGGGTTYVVGGLGEAFASATPMLVIASDIHRNSRGTGALTEIDQRALFSAVTKQVFLAGAATEVPTMVRDALDMATSGRPGPVALVIPEDVLDEEAARTDDVAGSVTVPRGRPEARRDDVAAAAEALASARHPALLVGSGAHYSAAYAEVAELASRVGAAVATSIHGKGVIADSHAWSVGVTGNNGGNELALDSLRQADVAVIIGSRGNATDTDSYTAPSRHARIIGVDLDPSRIARNYPDALTLAGDARTVLRQLIAALPQADRAGVDERRAALAHCRGSQSKPSRGLAPEGKLLVDDVVDTLAEILAESDPIVVADPGTPTPAVADRWPVRTPARNFVIPRGHGPMGFAIPAAVGVSIAQPERVVLAMTADGSFAMCCGELETIARFELPVITVQFTNHSMGWIKMLQHLYQDKRYFGVDPGPIDAVGVARACGLAAARPRTLDELRSHVERALSARTPLYLDVEVPHMIDVVPQVPAWHRALAGDRTRPVY